jgi:hypothetical protein
MITIPPASQANMNLRGLMVYTSSMVKGTIRDYHDHRPQVEWWAVHDSLPIDDSIDARV